MRHILSADDFAPELFIPLIEQTEQLLQDYPNSVALKRLKKAAPLAGMTGFNAFYKESTRTDASFRFATEHLGGHCIAFQNMREQSSEAKGETPEDTGIILCGYHPDWLVVRHDQTGGVARVAKFSTVPIINAGDGQGEHPTQAGLDYISCLVSLPSTVREIVITFVGDLKEGRTVRSLARLLARHGRDLPLRASHMHFVAPESLQILEDLKELLASHDVSFSLHDAFSPELLRETDVIYMTRIQNKEIAHAMGNGIGYQLSPELAAFLPAHARILHPLPRNSELPKSIDADPRAFYFQQAQIGMYFRMALLLHLMDVQLPK